jgi:cytochrome c556
MQHFQANTQALNAVREGQVGAASHMLGRAVIIQQLATMLGDAFPAGSAGEGSRALPAIWENQSEFAARVQAIQEASNALVEAARGGNAEQVQAAQGALQQTCGACHMAFRGPAPGN